MNGAAAWADAQAAVTIFAVDPVATGGIAVRARAGPVRDRWLDLLREMLPADAPMRRLPANADDDRMLGGLDLAATLCAQRPIARKGLLAEADGGVVVLAMAERMASGTAARLCAALDDGAVTLQRAGLACRFPTRFGIVALDEGIAPDERAATALLDRMAFHLDLTDVSVRDINDAFGNPVLDRTDVAAARAMLSSVRGPNNAVEALCNAAMALGIDSLRAPLLALRVARAAAASGGRSLVQETDLALAARLVFPSRATLVPRPREPEPPNEPELPQSAGESTSDADIAGDTPLEDLVLDAAQAMLPPDLLARLALGAAGRLASHTHGRAGQEVSAKRGRPIATRQGDPRNGARLHLLGTLKAAAPWQALRRRPGDRGPQRFEVRRDDFRIIRFRQRTGTTTVFAVDASGSAALHRLGEAKGAVELLLADSYVRRDQVALIAFRGQAAALLLPPTGSLLRAKRCLAALPGGGATPLAAGIDAAAALADTVRRGGRTPIITFLTDGRANRTRIGGGGRPQAEEEALASARLLRAAGLPALLVDTSPRPNPFARRLADEMRAQYVLLPHADSSALSRAVKSAAPA